MDPKLDLTWEHFTHTGKIEDYLQYRRQERQLDGQTPEHGIMGSVTMNAADHRRRGPQGLQD